MDQKGFSSVLLQLLWLYMGVRDTSLHLGYAKVVIHYLPLKLIYQDYELPGTNWVGPALSLIILVPKQKEQLTLLQWNAAFCVVQGVLSNPMQALHVPSRGFPAAPGKDSDPFILF